MSVQLTVSDRTSLRKCEKTIAQGISTFVDVGIALKQIRDSKLYREDYKTFDKYVEDRWQLKKRYAYNLIESAEAVENVRNCAQNLQVEGGENVRHGGQKPLPEVESQARELAKAPPEQQAEIWSEVVESNPNPTAQDVRAKVQEKKAATTATEPATQTASIVKDSLERDVPESLREHFAIGAQLAAIGRKIDSLKREVTELADENGGWFLPLQEIELDCKTLKGKVVGAAYWTACPRCHGPGCNRCDSAGFIPKSKSGQMSHADKEALGI